MAAQRIWAKYRLLRLSSKAMKLNNFTKQATSKTWRQGDLFATQITGFELFLFKPVATSQRQMGQAGHTRET
jgi:hypothetical protein